MPWTNYSSLSTVLQTNWFRQLFKMSVGAITKWLNMSQWLFIIIVGDFVVVIAYVDMLYEILQVCESKHVGASKIQTRKQMFPLRHTILTSNDSSLERWVFDGNSMWYCHNFVQTLILCYAISRSWSNLFVYVESRKLYSYSPTNDIYIVKYLLTNKIVLIKRGGREYVNSIT